GEIHGFGAGFNRASGFRVYGRCRAMNGDLSQIRRAVLGHEVPVMLDVEEAAIALDMSVTAARNRFADWSVCGDRYMVRAAEVRAALRAMKPSGKIFRMVERACPSC